jgi:branched-chain amino acid transport system ATP-binding protein
VTALLELAGLEVSYGPVRAVRGLTLSVEHGEAVGLIGPNGAGKTSTLHAIMGAAEVTGGEVRLRGRSLRGLVPEAIARSGIALVPEGRRVFASLTVEENLLLPLRKTLGRSGLAKGLKRAYELFPQLGHRRRQAAGTLSGGEQRMLALARVLAKPPRLLVCDELSLGLAPIIVDEVYKTLSAIRETGTTLLIVEQHVGHALGIADDVAVLVKGRVTYDGPVSEMGDLSERLLPTAGAVDSPSPNGQ